MNIYWASHCSIAEKMFCESALISGEGSEYYGKITMEVGRGRCHYPAFKEEV